MEELKQSCSLCCEGGWESEQSSSWRRIIFVKWERICFPTELFPYCLQGRKSRVKFWSACSVRNTLLSETCEVLLTSYSKPLVPRQGVKAPKCCWFCVTQSRAHCRCQVKILIYWRSSPASSESLQWELCLPSLPCQLPAPSASSQAFIYQENVENRGKEELCWENMRPGMVNVHLQSLGTRSSVREGFGFWSNIVGWNKSSSPGAPQVDFPISSWYLPQEGVVSKCKITRGAVALKSIMALKHLAKIGLNIPTIIVVWFEGGQDFPGYCSTSPPSRTWPEGEAGRAIWDLPWAVFVGFPCRAVGAWHWAEGSVAGRLMCGRAPAEQSVKYYGCVNFNQY